MATQSKAPYSESGYLQARVFTALGAIPIEGASVKISSSEGIFPTIAHDLITDGSGETLTVSLPAPPRNLSGAPGNPTPYALYRIEAYAEGYAPYLALNVPVFSEILSIQPISMVPLGQREAAPLIPPTVENEPIDLEGATDSSKEA
jgi:hypothetical protein